jgi:hypothetical protein
MKRILAILMAAFIFGGCDWHEEIYFDTPFASIFNTDGGTSSTVDSNFGKGVDSILSELKLTISVSSARFTEPITVDYELIVGDGLTEGVDYRIQQSTASPLKFSVGTYTMPIRILWLKAPSPDTSKDNTLTIRLTGSSLDGMLMGYPGPSAKGSSFTFTRI